MRHVTRGGSVAVSRRAVRHPHALQDARFDELFPRLPAHGLDHFPAHEVQGMWQTDLVLLPDGQGGSVGNDHH